MMFEQIDRKRGWLGWAVMAFILSASGCEDAGAPVLPTGEQIASYYAYSGGLEAEIRGNVAEVTITQPAAQIRRGGALWAKVGPYVLLFSDETRELFTAYPDLAAVRIVTRVSGGGEVARALLVRTELSDILWRRSLNIAGRARLEGSRHPRLLEELVEWGEGHTEFEYDARYSGR